MASLDSKSRSWCAEWVNHPPRAKWRAVAAFVSSPTTDRPVDAATDDGRIAVVGD